MEAHSDRGSAFEVQLTFEVTLGVWWLAKPQWQRLAARTTRVRLVGDNPAHPGLRPCPRRRDVGMRRVALLGDAFVDVQVGGVAILPSWGTDVSCSSVRLLPGGACGNTARQLGSLGAGETEVHFFSCVGGDEAGSHYVQTLEMEGILARPRQSLHVLSGVPQSCCVILSGSSDRAMCSCYETVHRVQIELFAEALQGAWALVHLGGYFNCIGLHDERLLEMLRTLRQAGSLVTMDPQHDCSGKWTGEGGHLLRLLPLLDVFLPNELELLHVTGAPSVDWPSPSPSPLTSHPHPSPLPLTDHPHPHPHPHPYHSPSPFTIHHSPFIVHHSPFTITISVTITITSHLSPLTSHLSPLTSHPSPLTLTLARNPHPHPHPS